MVPDIDIAECLRRGAIGVVGAIPGTLAAHPCDVVKMRQQVSGLGLAGTLRGIGSISHAYGGVTAGVGQKIITRGPMFLISEFCTQSAQRALALSRDNNRGAVRGRGQTRELISVMCARPRADGGREEREPTERRPTRTSTPLPTISCVYYCTPFIRC